MYKEVTNILTHKEIIKYLTDFFKANNINNFEYSHREYTDEPVPCIECKHQYTKITHLFAPFDIGNIEIYVTDDRIALKYVTYYKRYFDPSDELGYGLYGPVVSMMQDFWYLMVPGLHSDDYYWNYKYGVLEGCQVNSVTKEYIDKFLYKLFVERPFSCGDTTKEIAYKLINQFDDYSKNYSKTAFGDFMEHVGRLWYLDKWLWDTIPFMVHRADDLDKYDIERLIGLRN